MNKGRWEETHTTINVHRDTWKILNDMKEVGDSFDDVIIKLLKRGESN